MANTYFNHVLNRIAPGTRALDSQINNIADEIAAGFDKLPSESEINGNTGAFAENTGTSTAMVVTLGFTPILTDGFNFYVRVTDTNPGDANLNLNGTGVKSVRNSDGSTLTAGAIQAGIIHLAYDATRDEYLLISNNSIWGKPGIDGGATSEFCPNYPTYTKTGASSFQTPGVNSTSIFAPGRRLKFVAGPTVTYGTVATAVFSGGDSDFTMTMEGTDEIPDGLADVCVVSGVNDWQVVAADPFGGTPINDVAVGTISGTTYWVIVGDGGKIAVSQDKGLTWVVRVPAGADPTNINTVVFDPVAGGFFIAGDGWFTGTSTDTINWTWAFDATLQGSVSGASAAGRTNHARYFAGAALTGIVMVIQGDANTYITDGYTFSFTANFGTSYSNLSGSSGISAGVPRRGSFMSIPGSGDRYESRFTQFKYDPFPGADTNLVTTSNLGWEGECVDTVAGEYCVFDDVGDCYRALDNTPQGVNDWTAANSSPGFKVLNSCVSQALTPLWHICGGGGKISFSPDFGDNWYPISTALSIAADVTGIAYSEDDLSYVAVNTNGQIATSVNGGVYAVTPPPPPPPPEPFTLIAGDPFSGQPINAILSGTIGADTVWVICGTGGNLATSIDAGATWQVQATGLTENLNCIAYSGPRQEFFVGGANGVFVVVSGPTTVSVDTTTIPALGETGSLQIYDATWEIASGAWWIMYQKTPTARGARYSTDGGVTWLQSDSQITFVGDYTEKFAFDPNSPSNSWYWGVNEDAYAYISVLDTTDSQSLGFGSSLADMSLLHFESGTFGESRDWVVWRNDGDMTFHGNSTFQRSIQENVFTDQGDRCRAVDKIEGANRWIAVGDSGRAYVIDGADIETNDSWTEGTTPFTTRINDVHYNLTDDICIAVSANGEIGRTTDGLT